VTNSKENYNTLNTPKKYEYGNPSVLAWMKKQKRKRAEKQKQIETKKAQQIQKRKDYILELNKKQKERAQIIKKKRASKRIEPNKNEMVFDEVCNDQVVESNEDMHPANIMLTNLQNKLEISPTTQPKPKEMPLSDIVNKSLRSSPSKALLDDDGNVDPTLLLKIYDCIQQNKSMRVGVVKAKPKPKPKSKSKTKSKIKKRPLSRIGAFRRNKIAKKEKSNQRGQIADYGK